MLQSELKELLDYDPETGVFTWRNTRNGYVKAGKKAGTANGSGHIQITIDGKRLMAHRLAWLWCKGNMPGWELDHKNGDRADNRISNLRIATRSQNAQNSKLRNDNKVRLKGVHWSKVQNGWVAYICVHGEKRSLGRFNCPTAAHLAYCRAAKAHFREFARTK